MIEIPHLNMGPYLPGVGVVAVPATVNGCITIVTRTSNEHRTPGIPSPPDSELGLNKPGVWGYVRSAEANLWTPSMVQFKGTVDLSVLTAVLEEFSL